MSHSFTELPYKCDKAKWNITGIEEVAPDADGVSRYAVSLECTGCGAVHNRSVVRGIVGQTDAITNAESTFLLSCPLSVSF